MVSDWGFPGGAGGKEPPANAGDSRHEFSLWAGKIPWRRKATHSSVLVWKIPWTEEPGGLQSTGSQRFRHAHISDWSQESDAQSSGIDYKVAPHTSYSVSRGYSKHASNVTCAQRGILRWSKSAKTPTEVTTVMSTGSSSHQFSTQKNKVGEEKEYSR